MDDAGMARAVGEDAMAALAPEAGLFARLDPVNLTSSLLAVAWRAALNPVATSSAFRQFGSALARIGPDAAGRWSGSQGEEREPKGSTLANDKRFADPAWRENPVFFAIGHAYLAVQLADDLLAVGRGDPVTDAKARLAPDFMLAALAPRMPAAMHTFYLRSLYLRNELARGVLEVKGQRLSLADVKSDAYVVGAINDHIVPWPASYKTAHLMGGEVRYVLSSGGHIAGIVNPPGPKAWHEVARPPYPVSAAQWRVAAAHQSGSWWEDWTSWAGRRAGSLTDPPPMGSERYPAIADAPGSYVHG